MTVILLLGWRVVFGDLGLVFIVVLCAVVGVVSGVVSGGCLFLSVGLGFVCLDSGLGACLLLHLRAGFVGLRLVF